MSGSTERPPGRPPYAAQYPAEAYDYDDVVTGPVTGPPAVASSVGRPAHAAEPYTYAEPPRSYEHSQRPVLEATPRDDIYAPARETKTSRELMKAPIVPAGSVTGRSMTLVVSIMCFLACLTAGAVYMINQSADAWLKDIASEVTVQIEPREKVDTEKVLKDVTALLQQQSGIASVKALSIEDSAELLEPLLGHVDAL